MKASEAVKLVLLRRYSPWSRRPVCVPNTTPSIRGGSLDQRRCCTPVARSLSTRVWTDNMQGGQRDRDEEERRRRQQGGGAPEPSAGDYLAAGAAAATALAVGYGAYKIFGALSGGPAEQNHNQPHTSRTERQQQQMAKKTNYWLPEWLSPNILKSFWNKVEEQEDEERSAIREAVIVPEALRHPYNKFDPWFRNLNNVLRIDNGERKELFKAFQEIIKVLLEGMGETDPLFKYLFRDIAPVGSSWENLRICSPNEFDVNLILFEPNIQQDVKVEVVGSGHVAIRLDCGFDVSDKKVLKKFNNLDHIISIKAQLRNWIEGSYVTRSKVMNWLNGVVDRALFDLQHHQWASVNQIYRSISGPAVTINAIMKNGKEFSIDLVPAFELSQEHLPAVTSAKLRAKRISPSRTWYAIPKGPSEASPQKMWRTSLYQAERDLINGQNHLKPCIRIMKRLRDEQKWKVVSSYYLKTKFMWMMDEQEHWKMGLGKIMMFALKSLEDALAKGQINYYWDDKLNLLENRGNEYFFYNVRNCLRNIMKDFERSVHDDTVNPMRHFGCDKDGNLLRPTLLPTFAGMSPSSSLNNEAECAVM